jgi:hypothetical protein
MVCGGVSVMVGASISAVRFALWEVRPTTHFERIPNGSPLSPPQLGVRLGVTDP